MVPTLLVSFPSVNEIEPCPQNRVTEMALSSGLLPGYHALLDLWPHSQFLPPSRSAVPALPGLISQAPLNPSSPEGLKEAAVSTMTQIQRRSSFPFPCPAPLHSHRHDCWELPNLPRFGCYDTAVLFSHLALPPSSVTLSRLSLLPSTSWPSLQAARPAPPASLGLACLQSGVLSPGPAVQGCKTGIMNSSGGKNPRPLPTAG